MEFLRSMFQTPEAQIEAYPWASALVGHFAVGVILMALVGAVAWAVIAFWRALGRDAPWQPSRVALVACCGGYALWEIAQIVLAGGGIGDALVDWLAVACGALVAFGAWGQLIGPILFGLALLFALLIDGVTKRQKGGPR